MISEAVLIISAFWNSSIFSFKNLNSSKTCSLASISAFVKSNTSTGFHLIILVELKCSTLSAMLEKAKTSSRGFLIFPCFLNSLYNSFILCRDFSNFALFTFATLMHRVIGWQSPSPSLPSLYRKPAITAKSASPVALTK